MNFEEFARWLRQELREGRLFEHQVIDLLAQRILFDRKRNLLESEFWLRVVGFVANEQMVSDSTGALLKDAAQRFPGRMLYFEPVGFRLF